MPVGASIDVVVADGVMFTDDADIPLADVRERPNAVRGTLTRIATGVACTYGNVGVAFDLDDGDDG